MVMRRLFGVALSVVIISGCGSGSTDSAPTTDAREAPPVAAGWQRISSLGIEIDAPADWPINSWQGCGPTPDAMIFRAPGGSFGCGSEEVIPSLLQIDVIGSTEGPGREPSPAPAPVPTTIGGSDATVARSVDGDGRTTAVVKLPDQRVEVLLAGTDPALIDRMLAGLRTVDVDSAGCSVTLPDSPAWDRPAAGPKVELGSADSVAVCLYAQWNSRLQASTVLTGPDAQTAVTSVNAAAAGVAPNPSPDTCPGDEEDRSPVWLAFRHPDGTTTPARLRFSPCADRYLATPGGVSHATRAQLAALLETLHSAYFYSQDLPAR